MTYSSPKGLLDDRDRPGQLSILQWGLVVFSPVVAVGCVLFALTSGLEFLGDKIEELTQP